MKMVNTLLMAIAVLSGADSVSGATYMLTRNDGTEFTAYPLEDLTYVVKTPGESYYDKTTEYYYDG